jgi:hypothetical protein
MKTSRLAVKSVIVAALVVAALSLGNSARAELFFSDSFQYPVGPLLGQGPPAGAPPGQGAWTVVGNPQVSAKPLSYGRIFSTGGSVILAGINNESAYANIDTINSGVVWIGFLIARSGSHTLGYADLNIGGFTTRSIGFGLLDNAGVFGIDNDTGDSSGRAYTTLSPSARPSWLVVRLDFTAGTQCLYVNPSRAASPRLPDAELQMTSDFQAVGFNQVILDAGANDDRWFYDEVRIGATFADVLSGQ